MLYYIYKVVNSVKLTVESHMELLFEMANIRGKSVKIPHRLNFSFYFSPKDAVESKDICHGLRVKPLFDPEKMSIDKAGTLKLHGDWKYIPGSDDKNIGTKAIKEMKNFFLEYKTLFAAVWEKELPPDALYDYFRGTITFNELLQEFYFYDDFSDEMKDIQTVDDLTQFVDINELFDLWLH